MQFLCRFCFMLSRTKVWYLQQRRVSCLCRVHASLSPFRAFCHNRCRCSIPLGYRARWIFPIQQWDIAQGHEGVLRGKSSRAVPEWSTLGVDGLFHLVGRNSRSPWRNHPLPRPFLDTGYLPDRTGSCWSVYTKDPNIAQTRLSYNNWDGVEILPL